MQEQFQEAWDKLVEKLQSWLNQGVAMIPNLVLAAIVLVIAVFLARLVKKQLRNLIKRLGAKQTIIDLGANIGTTIFFIISLLVVLSILNLDQALTSIIAGAGVVGLAVGLAFQDPILNLFSGIMMSIRAYYSVGDVVTTNSYTGTIEHITLRTTVLRTPIGSKVIIPNKDVVQNPIENWSIYGRRRVDMECGVGYGMDLKKSQRLAKEAIAGEFDLNEGEVEVFFHSFGDSSINFTARFWVEFQGIAKYKEAMSRAVIAVKAAYDREDINIPFPIRTLDFGLYNGELDALGGGRSNGRDSQES